MYLYLVGAQVSSSVSLAFRFLLCFSFPCIFLVFLFFGASVLSAPKKYLEDVRTLLLVTSICIFVSLFVSLCVASLARFQNLNSTLHNQKNFSARCFLI